MTELAEETKTYLSNFSRIEKQVGGTKRMWLDHMPKAAMDPFSEVGFPTIKNEQRRTTKVPPLAKIPFQPGEHVELHGDDIAAFSFGHDASIELVFVNGHFAPKLSVTRSLPRGVKASSLAGALEADGDLIEQHLGKYADIRVNPFVALNTGFVRDGAFIHLPRNVIVEKPIHLMFVSTPSAEPTVAHPRILIVAEDNAEATIVKSF